LEQHFPGDPDRVPLENDWSDSKCNPEFINRLQLERAIKSFGPFKAAGGDEIFPAMLQQGIEVLAPQVLPIMKACVRFGYMPKLWRNMKVVFLPKPAKDSYDRASSWRPISLTSFLLKTLERLIDWHIRTPTLVERLKMSNQFAYLSRVSTEAALHQLVARIEKVLKSKEVALGAFLDIKGAFSDVPFDALMSGLRRNGVDGGCARFIGHMLSSRTVEANYMGETFRREVERGCPQGGVLSPLLWNLTVEEILSEIKMMFPMLYTQGYADDLAILSYGIDLGVVSERIQAAINRISSWCRRARLSVNDKLALLLFTRRRRVTTRVINLGGAPLPYVERIKYLGVTIDNKLTWGPHCTARANRATIALAQCRRAVGPTWELTPKICHWLYTAVVRPGIEYGSMVWVACTAVRCHMRKLEKVQRQALISATGALRSCPVAALEALTDTSPIEVRLQQVALQTYHRLRLRGQWLDWPGIGSTNSTTHIDLLTRLATQIPEMFFPCDCDAEFLPLDRNFRVNIRSRRDWQERGIEPEEEENWYCFTDGSKTIGDAGAGCVVLSGDDSVVRQEIVVPLCQYTGIYQAELIGLLEASSRWSEAPDQRGKIAIYTDSLSALQSLTSSERVVGLVREVFAALNKISISREVVLNWIPSHCGYEGNEIADSLARRAAELKLVGPLPAVAVSIATVKLCIRDWTRKQHESSWKNIPGCKHTKIFIPRVERYRGMNLISLSRNKLRNLIFCITGHNPLAKHLCKMGLSDSPTCIHCGEDEDAIHFLGVCERYAALRYEIVQAHTLSLEELQNVPLARLIKFIISSGRFADREGHGSAH